MAFLQRRLGSEIIRTMTLKRSNHVLTMDYEKDLIAEEIIKFFGGES
jgi:esterase/lipase